MHIKRAQLTDLRGFKELAFDFDRGGNQYAGWTVITGDNGSGKSTLLKALAMALVGKDTALKLQSSFAGWIRQGSGTARIEIELVASDGDGLTDSGRAPTKPFPVCLEIRRSGREPVLDEVVPAGKPPTYRTPQRGPWSSEAPGWFSCGYGPFRRVFGASSEATRQMVAPGSARHVTMFQEAASLAEVDVWLRGLHHKTLENRAAETQQLALLIELLRDDLLPQAITVDRVDSDGLWLRDRNGIELSWGEMSDGYRAALALLADIMRHLIEAYGHENLVSRDRDGRPHVARSGVVLIDEVDAHLHPSWQREIGFWLKRRFPNIQFIVTSHSPIICQASDACGLFTLPEPASSDAPRRLSEAERQQVVAGRPDTILRSAAFGLENTRSPVAVDARAELSRLGAKRRSGLPLTQAERVRQDQLQLFAVADEEI
jgi:energy-coupling factor transporter ATP-binding protein EcfA2